MPARSLFDLLENWRYLTVTLLVGGIYFAINYQLMRLLPGHRNLQCIPGAGFTMQNILFSLVTALLLGMLVAGLIALVRMRETRSTSLLWGSLLGLGSVLGSLTVFCTLCTLPVLFFFGLSIGLATFADHEIWWKIGSIASLILGLWFLDRQLRRACLLCQIRYRRKYLANRVIAKTKPRPNLGKNTAA